MDPKQVGETDSQDLWIYTKIYVNIYKDTLVKFSSGEKYPYATEKGKNHHRILAGKDLEVLMDSKWHMNQYSALKD